MGLDTVELVMEIEETFGIAIPDEDAEQMRTVGDVYEFILEQRRVNKSKKPSGNRQQECASAVAFYELRRGLMGFLDLPKDDITPSTRIDDLIPRQIRREIWSRFKHELSLQLPPVQLPAWVRWCIRAFAIVAGVIAAVVCARVFQLQVAMALLFGVISALFLGQAFPFGWWRFKRELSEHYQNVGDLAEGTMLLNLKVFARYGDLTSPDDIWLKLRGVIVEQLGLDPAIVTKEASFVNDLGAD